MKRRNLHTLSYVSLVFLLSCGTASDDNRSSGNSDLASAPLETQVTQASGPAGDGAGREPAVVLESENRTLLESLGSGPAVAGDGNADGCVSGADYTIWADNLGAPAPTGPGEGDYNGDGAVTGADYTIWADNFSDGCVVPPANVEDIQVTPSSVMLTELGETIAISARAFSAGGQELDTRFTWHSSHPDQLTVDQTGQVTAMGVASGEIWAEANGVESLPSMVDMVLLDPHAYVTNTAAHVVTVINTLTDVVTATIPVGRSPTRAAVTRDGAHVYVANTGGNSISVIDAATNGVVATIPTMNAPTAVAVTPNGAEVYVLDTGGVLQVIDTAFIATGGATTIATIPLGLPSFNQFGASIAILPDGTRAYVVVSGALHVLDTDTLEVLGSIDVGASPSRVVVSPDSTTLFVTTSFGASSLLFSGQVVVVDTATNMVRNAILLPNLVPDAIAITPDGSRAYVAIVQAFANTNYGMAFIPDNHIAVVDLTSNVLSGWITVPSTPAGGLAITPDRLHLYVSMSGADSISVIDTETNSLVHAGIGVDAVPTGLVISSAQGLAN